MSDAVYDYAVYQLVGREEIPAAERGLSAAVEGMSAVLGGLTAGERYTFIVRAVVKDVDGSVINQSLGAKVAVKML